MLSIRRTWSCVYDRGLGSVEGGFCKVGVLIGCGMVWMKEEGMEKAWRRDGVGRDGTDEGMNKEDDSYTGMQGDKGIDSHWARKSSKNPSISPAPIISARLSTSFQKIFPPLPKYRYILYASASTKIKTTGSGRD